MSAVIFTNNPGLMDRQLILQTRSFSQDETGGKVEEWTDTCIINAQLIPMKTAERIAAQAERVGRVNQFRIRWRQISEGENRIRYNGDLWNITGINEEGRKNRLLLTCESIQATT